MREGRKELGFTGEELAVKYLRKRGYKILERNYRCPLGEIDAVALKDGFLVFVEIKTRRTSLFGPPQEAVDARKRKKLKHLALHYLSEKRLGERLPLRFDVVAVDLSRGEPSVELIPDAFET
ncbi:MAG: YraN family protein [Deltaproteobacteria bacterium]|nr:MAG: YraN family protein [Deltaproteobacteria bacterium]RLA85900.1 MAG: YraN family protein [Deltaproteobacteria bacterium]